MIPAMTAEPGIPLPRKQVGQIKYPLHTMKVRESFLVEVERKSEFKLHQVAVMAAAWRENKRSGKKFTSRQVSEGVRVWRIK